MRFEEFEGNKYIVAGDDENGKKTLINNDEIVFVDKGTRVPILSLLQNPRIVFKNTIQADKTGINTPITYKDYVIGVVTDITEENICCKLWDKFVRFFPEYNSPDGIEDFKLFGINISLPQDEINKQLETENYVAVEMYKQFLKDDPLECTKIRKQILKKQPVDYFKNAIN